MISLGVVRKLGIRGGLSPISSSLLTSPSQGVGDFAKSRSALFLLGQILWKVDFGDFWANFVGAEFCGGLIFGQILWEPNFVEAFFLGEICGRQNSDFLEGLQFLYQIWAILLGEEIHMKV